LSLRRPGYALLETTGRKTGKPRRTPVGDARIGGQFWIVAEHGMKAGYVLNIARNPRVRLKLREGLRSRWYAGKFLFVFAGETAGAFDAAEFAVAIPQ
jgi:deazaflavin-dependent oxidoreductase (nitroreductase family)